MFGKSIAVLRARLRQLGPIIRKTIVPGWSAIVSIAQGTVWILGAFLTVLGTMYAHRLSFELHSDGSRVPEPFDIPATITNSGIVPLEDLSIEIGLCRINAGWRAGVYESATGAAIPESQCAESLAHFAHLGVQKWSGHKLGVDEKYEIRLVDGVLQALGATPNNRPSFRRFSSADITIILKYRSFLPFTQSKYFRLHAEKQPDDTVRWEHLTIDKR